jgi:lipoprotein-anchoring transpeptidase ErfK/SrfK
MQGQYLRLSLAAVSALLLLSGSPSAQQVDPDTRLSIEPYGYRGPYSTIPRTTVSFDTKRYRPGSIVINTAERRLYLVVDEGRAIRYGIGVGRLGFTWAGTAKVSQKREWPDWTPPPQMLRRRPDLPRYMKGGPDNPLGARAIYLGSTLYRIHGSNEPETIGQAVSSGCFRMTNEDVIHLYDQVKVGAPVHVLVK